MGTYKSATTSAIHPLRMYILVKPMLVIHGTNANGIAMETTLRTKATPTKASAVSWYS